MATGAWRIFLTLGKFARQITSNHRLFTYIPNFGVPSMGKFIKGLIDLIWVICELTYFPQLFSSLLSSTTWKVLLLLPLIFFWFSQSWGIFFFYPFIYHCFIIGKLCICFFLEVFFDRGTHFLVINSLLIAFIFLLL